MLKDTTPTHKKHTKNLAIRTHCFELTIFTKLKQLKNCDAGCNCYMSKAIIKSLNTTGLSIIRCKRASFTDLKSPESL